MEVRLSGAPRGQAGAAGRRLTPPGGPPDGEPGGRAFALRAGLALAATLVALTPVLVPALRDPIPPSFEVWLFLGGLACTLPVLTVAACWRLAPLDLDRARRRDLFVLLVLATLLCAHVHHTNVDTADFKYAAKVYPDGNTGWQRETQALVMHLEPTYYGHNVRLLSNSLVHGLQLATGTFESARTIYRLTFGFLLVLSIYALGRVWLSHAAALLALLFYLSVYPVSIRLYAGQLLDPMSHLSFVLGLLCMARRRDADLALVILIGALAKESVVALTGLYVLMRWRERPRWPAVATLVAGLFVVWLVRRLVYAGVAVDTTTLSGVGWGHMLENLRPERFWLWFPQLGLTIGLFLPFLALAWRQVPRDLRIVAAGLSLILPLTSLRFSWLYEARNYVPAVIPLAIVAAGHLLGELKGDPDRTGDSAG